jgi:hypothetical protein
MATTLQHSKLLEDGLPEIWQQTTMEGLCLAVEREVTKARDDVHSQFRFWEDDFTELQKAIDGLPVDLAELGKHGERLLEAVDTAEHSGRSAYSAHLDCINRLEGLLEELYEVRDLQRHKTATSWRVEMMRELYGLDYAA